MFLDPFLVRELAGFVFRPPTSTLSLPMWEEENKFDLSCLCSGLVIPERQFNKSVPEVTATSGSAFLHFYSDAAYNMSGFNVSFK